MLPACASSRSVQISVVASSWTVASTERLNDAAVTQAKSALTSKIRFALVVTNVSKNNGDCSDLAAKVTSCGDYYILQMFRDPDDSSRETLCKGKVSG